MLRCFSDDATGAMPLHTVQRADYSVWLERHHEALYSYLRRRYDPAATSH